MRRLIIMRHAKSDWDSGASTDHDRPLNKRGRRDAPRVAAKLVEIQWQPEHVLSSDSQRTRETYERMAPEFAPQPTVEYLGSFYEGGPDQLSAAIASISEKIQTALALGHNPGWEQAVSWLTGEAVHLTTANAALIECDAETWSDVVRQAGNWSLQSVVRPKEI